MMVLKGNLPPLGWSHLLVNGHFGWLTDETGCGHLWYGNARETPLTPWNNDPLAIGGPEWFLLTWQGETHSLFAGGDGLPVTVTYGFGWARWEKQWPGGTVRTTAFVPWDEDCRILTVECAGETGELRHIVTGRPEVNYSFAERLCLITTQTGTSRTGWNAWETDGFRFSSQDPAGDAKPLSKRLVSVSGDRLSAFSPYLSLSKWRGLWVSGPASGYYGAASVFSQVGL